MFSNVLTDLLPNMTPGILGVTDFWMARWLTPVWFLGIGVIFGLMALAVFLGLCYLLSKVSFLDTLRSTGIAHGVAALGTIVCTFLASRVFAPVFGAGLSSSEYAMDEYVLFMLATGLLFAILW